MHSARLAKTLRERHPDWTLYAVGGDYLAAEVVKSAGGRLIGDTNDMSGIGITNSVMRFPRAVKLSLALKKLIRTEKINAVVLCDWGAFNCGHLGFFKKQGVPVLYYFPPGSWKRTGSGGLGIASQVDRVATPFEWSAQRLVAAGAKAEWVGHPMLEAKHDEAERLALREEFGVTPGEKLIALLPGSRMHEINCLAPRLAATAEALRKRGGMHFIVAASQRRAEIVRKRFPEWVKVVSERTADVLFASDAAVVKSGSATLEAAVIGVPQVIVYDMPWVGRIEWLVLYMWKKKFRFVGIPNVILQRLAVKELLGPACKVEAIVETVTELLDNEATRARMKTDYEEIRQQLGARLPKQATLRTAEMVEELIAEKRASAISA